MKESLLNQLQILTGGFAIIKNDIVFQAPANESLDNPTKRKEKWQELVPIFPYHRIYLITEGTASFKLSNSTKIKMEKNKLYLVSPFLIQSSEINANNSHFYLHFKSDNTSIDPFEYYAIDLCANANENDVFYFKEIFKYYNKDDIQSQLKTKAYFALLLSKFFTNSHPNSVNTKLFPIIKYINENITNKITSKQLAEKFGYNDAYFSSMFSKAFNISVTKYITNKKIIYARQLLANKNASIKEISDNLGFANEFYFNRVFKKIAGVTPGKWQKNFNSE